MNMTASMSVSAISSDPLVKRRGFRTRAARRFALRVLSAGLTGALLVCTSVLADNVYQEPSEFVAEAFAGGTPAPQVLWLTGPLRDQVQDILDHKPRALRVRYWAQSGRSAWVLDEIGKERPITVGIVVGDDGIERIKVLVFRESRGWEVRHPFFTEQFVGAKLEDGRRLDRSIDGISGATLSVRALKKLARVALLLHRQAASAP